MRVLVIEDERQVAEMLRESLVEFGYEPELVRTAEAGLGALKLNRPDAVLLDLYLPRMTGLEFLELHAVREAAVPIIAISGAATEAEVRWCLGRGASDIIKKPVSLALLQAVLAGRGLRGDATRTADRITERRHSPHRPITIPVRIVDGAESWRSTSSNLSALGIQVLRTVPVCGAVVKVCVTLPDAGPGLELLALLVRQEADAYVFRFVNLDASAFEQLSRFLCVRPGVMTRIVSFARQLRPARFNEP